MPRVAHSIFDTTALLETLQNQFEVPTLDSCLFYRSLINDTYQLRAGDELYYLRVYQANWRTRAEVDAELQAIEDIHRLGGSVARPVPLLNGGFVLDLEAPEATRPAVLFAEAPGVDLGYYGEAGPANARRYGQAVARLHTITAELDNSIGRQPLDAEAMFYVPRAIVASRLKVTAEANYFADLCDRLRDYVTSRSDLTIGFCHGDLNSSNVHFNGDRATTIDFDCCGWGWLAGDIAAFSRGVTLGRHPAGDVTALIGAYLDGYESERSIAGADREALPAFLLIQRIWVSSLHMDGHHRWGNISFGEPYARKLIQWLQAWEGVLETGLPRL